MTESMPSRAQPPQEARKPRFWLEVRRVDEGMAFLAGRRILRALEEVDSWRRGKNRKRISTESTEEKIRARKVCGGMRCGRGIHSLPIFLRIGWSIDLGGSKCYSQHAGLNGGNSRVNGSGTT